MSSDFGLGVGGKNTTRHVQSLNTMTALGGATEAIDESIIPECCDEERGSLSSPLLNSSETSLRHRPPSSSQQGPRILDRDAAFHQSKGLWQIHRLSRGRSVHHNFRLRVFWRIWNEWIKGDWFHRLAYQRTCMLMFILFVVYSLIVVFFAFVYLAVSKLGRQIHVNPDGSVKVIAFCDMDINDHMEALYFSLSTMTTIGYGVSDYYFGGCWTPLLLVLWQVCTAITFNAIAVGLLFQKISTGRRRGKTITFSDKAVIRRIRGIPHLMFRIGELRRYHLIEASLRVYCVRHNRIPIRTKEDGSSDVETAHFLTRQMKLLHPDAAFGSHILMSIPQVLVHRLDETSPLVPPRTCWYDSVGGRHISPHASKTENTTLDDAPRDTLAEMDDLEAFLLDREAEIIVLVEGTDEGTGAATQARHSYKPSDLAWNHTFAPCVTPQQTPESQSWVRRRQSPMCTIDFAKFHDIVPAPADCDACAFVLEQ
jgi:hypothetical protein